MLLFCTLHGLKMSPKQIRFYFTKKSDIYKKCFNILGLSETADQNTVRQKYIELVKKLHPDNCLPESSAEKFQQVDNAFKILQKKFAKNRRGIYDDDDNNNEDEEKIFDIRHTAPQHRQYLSFDGIGIGTPAQREKQYQQVKAMKAQERVLNHRLEKIQAADNENMLMKKSPQKNHDIRTKYGFDRVVEDLIQEAMSKGDFDNLSGNGKPLSDTQSQNPYLDFTTIKLNKILLDNGFTPEWITLQREIREDLDVLRNNLANKRGYVGDLPLSENEDIKWRLMINDYETDVQRINKKIDKFNLIVPLLDNQLFRVKLNRISDEVLNDNSIERKMHKPETDKSREDKKNASSSKNDANFFSFLTSLF